MEALFNRLVEDASVLELDPPVEGLVHRTRGTHAFGVLGDLCTMEQEMHSAVECFERAGARAELFAARMLCHVAPGMRGDHNLSRTALLELIGEEERRDSPYALAFVRMEYGLVMAMYDDIDGIPALEAAIEPLRGSARLESHARFGLTMLLLVDGQLERAAEQADLAAVLDVNPVVRSRTLSLQARVLLLLGQLDRALAIAEEADRLEASAPGFETFEGIVQLVLANALDKHGRRGEARAALARGLGRMQHIAASLPQAERAAFYRVPMPNRALFELARAWGVPTPT